MRKIALIILISFLSHLSALFAVDEKIKQGIDSDGSPYSSYAESFSLFPSPNNIGDSSSSVPVKSRIIKPNTVDLPPLKTKDVTTMFRLDQKNPIQFDFKLIPRTSFYPKWEKTYSKAVLDISGINLAVWSFDNFILKKHWAQISINSIYNNLNKGFEWDNGAFISNQLAHPYHGAMYFSTAQLNGLDLLESALYTASGSLMWELFFESNYPSINDTIMTTLGGMILGGPLYRIAGMLRKQNSGGFKGLLQKSLMLIANPSFGYSLFSNHQSGLNIFSENHNYNFHLPLGTYWSATNKQKYLIGMCIENKDFIEKDLSKIKPYDWFLLDLILSYHKDSSWDKEIFTTALLSGTRTKNGLRGIFGVYDYVDTQVIEMISAAGIGLGAVSIFNSEPNYFTESSGVISFIFGGSSPSLNKEKYHFGEKDQKPYYFGPGIMSRFKIEMGKKGLGSILAKFSQYWVNSMFFNAQESLSISSFNLKISITRNSQINLGYDCYIRQGTFLKQHIASSKSAFKFFYIHEF
jgi:hypothetical protein